MNPMEDEGEDLINISTKVMMLAEVHRDVCNQDEIGQEKYIKFAEERIKTNAISIGARMKKVLLKTWKCARDLEMCQEVSEAQTG